MISEIEENFRSKISYFSKYFKNIDILETESFVRVDSGLASDTFNIIFVKGNNRQKMTLESNEIIKLSTYFNDKKYPAAIWVNKNVGDLFSDIFNENGFSLAETELGMYISIKDIHVKQNKIEGFIIKKVESKKEMKQFSQVLSSIFGESQEATFVKEHYDLVAEDKLYNKSFMKFYIGTYNGIPVSTGTLFFTENSIGIYDISTNEKYRGKGFGSGIFDYLLEEIKYEKREYCVLQASEDGAGIYKSRGFHEDFSISVYENREFLENKL